MLTVLAVLASACSGDPGAPIPDPAQPAQTALPNEPTPPPGPGPVPPAPGAVALTVTVQGTGAVRSQPAGIDCPGACSATFAPGTRVTLVAAPAEGWKLATWGGACSGEAACALVLSKTASVSGSLALVDPRWDPAVGIGDCAAAWGVAGEKLSSCDTTKDDYIVIHKSKRNLALCKSGKLVKNVRSGLGSSPTGDKVKEGDGKTPEGVFFVPRLIPDSAFYKGFLISYPSREDADRGMATSLITSQQRSQIHSAHSACVEPPQLTALGGEIAIHGSRSDKDWTRGDVGLDDSSVDLLWGAIGVGDTVVVVP